MSSEYIATFDDWLAKYHPGEPVTQELYAKYLRWHMGEIQEEPLKK